MARRSHPNHRAPHTLPRELRRAGVPVAVRTWIEQRVSARIVSVRRLAGASSAALHAVQMDNGARLVVRRYVWPGFLDAEPEAVTRERDALRFAAAHGLPVPVLVAVDEDGHEVGDGVPVVLSTMLGGRAVAHPDPNALALAAATVHAVDPSTFPHEYFRWYDATMMVPPRGTRRPELWERAISVWRHEMPDYQPVFIHRDFHPGNLLWARGRLTGVVDWANACRGPRGCDIAHCSANLRAWCDEAAAEAFRAAYEALTGEVQHPYWDVASMLEHGPSYWTAARLHDNEPRLERALAALGRMS